MEILQHERSVFFSVQIYEVMAIAFGKTNNSVGNAIADIRKVFTYIFTY